VGAVAKLKSAKSHQCKGCKKLSGAHELKKRVRKGKKRDFSWGGEKVRGK